MKWLAAIISSVAVSAVEKRPTLVRWDGDDWEFKWRGGSYYSNFSFARPRSITISENLFMTTYTPSPGDVVLDVGAGGGTQVRTFSEMVGPSGRVISIEADPSAARRLRKQVGGLRFDNVEILELAVGDTDGMVSLSKLHDGGIGNSIVAIVGKSSVSIPCRPMEAVLSELDIREIAFMKMNIEGAELKALKGLGESLRTIKEMCISCHDFTGDPSQRTYGAVTDYLQSRNFYVRNFPGNPDAPWEAYYLFATRKTDSAPIT